MKYTDIPENSMCILMEVTEEGDLSVSAIQNLSDELDPSVADRSLDLLNGINLTLKNGYELTECFGRTARLLAEATYLEEDIKMHEFDDEEPILDALVESNVIQIKKRLN